MGSGLAHGLATWGREAMAEMTAQWPFFATLVDDVEMSLAKADPGIFEGYSRQSPLHGRMFPRIRAEFERTCAAILALRDADELLSLDPRLRRSIRLRNPYVDPVNLLQQSFAPLARRRPPRRRHLPRPGGHGERHQRRHPEHRLARGEASPQRSQPLVVGPSFTPSNSAVDR